MYNKLDYLLSYENYFKESKLKIFETKALL